MHDMLSCCWASIADDHPHSAEPSADCCAPCVPQRCRQMDSSPCCCRLTTSVLNNLCVYADAFAVMVSRICGILGGCLISLFLSVLVFPTSASQKATNGLSEGLEALTSLSRMAWGQEGKSAQAFSANSRFCFTHHSRQAFS